MEKKGWGTSSSVRFFLRRLNVKRGGAWPWKLKSSGGMRRKKPFNLHLWFVDGVLFKIVSVFEGVVLISTLCAFFICCGCHF